MTARHEDVVEGWEEVLDVSVDGIDAGGALAGAAVIDAEGGGEVDSAEAEKGMSYGTKRMHDEYVVD